MFLGLRQNKNLKMSPWAQRNCDGHFSPSSDILSTLIIIFMSSCRPQQFCASPANYSLLVRAGIKGKRVPKMEAESEKDEIKATNLLLSVA